MIPETSVRASQAGRAGERRAETRADLLALYREILLLWDDVYASPDDPALLRDV